MSFKIKKFCGETSESTTNEIIFYVQSHGYNAGRPLRQPIRNCWEFRSNRKADFEILCIVFESKILKNFIRGSVIPFISLGDYRKIIFPILENTIHENNTLNGYYLQIQKIEEYKTEQSKILELVEKLKISISYQALKSYNLTHLNP